MLHRDRIPGILGAAYPAADWTGGFPDRGPPRGTQGQEGREIAEKSKDKIQQFFLPADNPEHNPRGISEPEPEKQRLSTRLARNK